ncbi:MAG: efflux RND transporter periplasmic adaptor subunit [Planctomycetia bacterium]|nr:efflux RND transporter periplasmic adaptor subunit [Planctomycetia bacterium]
MTEPTKIETDDFIHQESITSMNITQDLTSTAQKDNVSSVQNNISISEIKSLEEVYATKPKHTRRWRIPLMITAIIIIIFGVLQIPAVGNWVSSLFFADDNGTIMFSPVERGTFIHEVTVRGDISSSSNVSIKCNVANTGGTMILEVIEEGTHVKKGDKLVVLDSSTFDDQINTQEISVNNSKASYESAKNELETAKIALAEYEEGSYNVTLSEYESEVTSAEEELRRAEAYYIHSQKLYQKGFITKSQLEADEFSMKNAEIKRDIANTKIKVLNKYTREKNLIQYQSDIRTAEAKVDAQKRAYELEIQKLEDLRLRKQNCTILSPQDGQVVYANQTSGPAGTEFVVQEGVNVRERQTILLLPDPKRLQVTADVHEGRINYIKAGMPVTLRLDALPGEVITGVVSRVNEFPQPTNHWMGNVKEYRVTIKLDPREGLRPGMTAETRILVDKQDDVLTIPTHCVFEHGGKFYCITRKENIWKEHEITLGASNGKTVIVLSGISEDEDLVCGAFNYRDKVSLPILPPGQTSTAFTPSSPEILENAMKEAEDLTKRSKNQEQQKPRERGTRPTPGASGSLPEGFNPQNITPEMREEFQRRMQEGGMPSPPGNDGERPMGPPPGDGGGMGGPPGGGGMGPPPGM